MPIATQGPSQFRFNWTFSQRMRFKSLSGAQTTVFTTDLGSLLAVGTTIAQVTSVLGAVRVKRVELFAPVAAQGGQSTTSIEWLSAQAPNIEFSDTSMSVATPAHVNSVPPPNSLASYWSASNVGVALMNLIVPEGGTIDVWFDFTLTDDELFAPNTVVVALAAIGTLYYMALDNTVDVGAVRYPPISLTTTS